MTTERSAADMPEGPSEALPDSDADHHVGLVVVSHSRSLARAALALANEMVHGRAVRIEVAAGLDEHTFGTDAVSIMEAIERADGPSGVVVLMDLGSALLSAELALDLLQDPAVRDRVTLSPAPVVEGLIVAAVAAAGGGSRSEVAAEARDALMGKAAHLSTSSRGRQRSPRPGRRTGGGRRLRRREPPRAARAPGRPTGQRGARTRRDGLAVQPHLPASDPVPAVSLSRVAMLAALQGHQVEVRASGSQAQEAVDHVLALARRRFDETVDEPVPERCGRCRDADARSGASAGRPSARFTGDRHRTGVPAEGRAGRGRPATARRACC
jgi:phosphocarrier protein FPr